MGQRQAKSHWLTVNLPLCQAAPIHSCRRIPHPCFLLPPPTANSWTLPKTPSQLIRHCLLPSEPVQKRPPRSQQAFPLKLLQWWPPGMPIALGTGRTGMGREGGEGLGRRIIETAPSCSCAGASQSKIGGQQREMLSTPKDRRHFTPQQAFLNPLPLEHAG